MLPTYDLRAVIAALRPSPHIGAMHLDLSDDEAAALAQESFTKSSRKTATRSRRHPHAEGDPRQTETGAGPGALATAEGLRVTANNGSQKTRG